MTPRQRNIGRIGGIVAMVASSLAIGAVVWRPTAEATGIATQRWTAQAISDSMTVFRHEQAIRDAIREQNQRLRDTLIMGKLDRLICMHDRDCPTSDRIR